MGKQNDQAKGYATIKKINVIDLSSREKNADPLTDQIRQGGKLIEKAIEAELVVFTGMRGNVGLEYA